MGFGIAGEQALEHVAIGKTERWLAEETPLIEFARDYGERTRPAKLQDGRRWHDCQKEGADYPASGTAPIRQYSPPASAFSQVLQTECAADSTTTPLGANFGAAMVRCGKNNDNRRLSSPCDPYFGHAAASDMPRRWSLSRDRPLEFSPHDRP
jgi:hypothetical protein